MPDDNCWRCGKTLENGGDGLPESCPHCAASLTLSGISRTGQTPAFSPSEDDKRISTGFKGMLWMFGLLLLTSVIYGISILHGSDALSPHAALTYQFVVEGFDTLIVVFGWLWIRKASPLAPFQSTQVSRVRTWLLAVPLLAAALGVNMLYHSVLTDYIGEDLVIDPIISEYGLSPWVLLAYCLQPAIVEELFFRHVALGKLRDAVGPNTAIYLSSLMFGLCHLFSPLSVPVLMLIGVMLGYLRLKSGSLLLPMLAHFLHNLIIVWMDFQNL